MISSRSHVQLGAASAGSDMCLPFVVAAVLCRWEVCGCAQLQAVVSFCGSFPAASVCTRGTLAWGQARGLHLRQCASAGFSRLPRFRGMDWGLEASGPEIRVRRGCGGCQSCICIACLGVCPTDCLVSLFADWGLSCLWRFSADLGMCPTFGLRWPMGDTGLSCLSVLASALSRWDYQQRL